MEQGKLKDLLEAVAAGEVSSEAALGRLRSLPFEDLGFAKLDHHRALRKGYPESIFCEGKSPEQVVEIVTRMRDHGSNVLGTRCGEAVVEAVQRAHPDVVYHEEARAITLRVHAPEILGGYVAVVCAGTSDIPVAEEAVVTCESTGCTVKRVYDVGVAGIHRLFEQREVLEKSNVCVVCAGMEGALPTVVAGLIEAPVVGVPTSVGYGANFGGVAALLTMLNSCASGVAVVNIDSGFAAGMFAAAINRIVNRRSKA